MEQVRRVFVEKRPGFDIEAQQLRNSFRDDLGIEGLRALRIFKRYDFSGVNDAEYASARDSILSEPNCDFVYDETLPELSGLQVFAVEYLPGQYDQRADSAAQCVQLLTQKERPLFRTATVYAFDADLAAESVEKIHRHLVNPVEARAASMDKPETLEQQAGQGRRYLEALRGEVKRLMLTAEQETDGAVIEAMTGKLGEEELCALERIYRKRALKRLGLHTQLVYGETKTAAEDENDFRV